MVTDRSTQIGCGISNFQYKWGNTMYDTWLLACNYASTNMIGSPVYKVGSKASGCLGGPDQVFTGLCKTTEKINANSFA